MMRKVSVHIESCVHCPNLNRYQACINSVPNLYQILAMSCNQTAQAVGWGNKGILLRAL